MKKKMENKTTDIIKVKEIPVDKIKPDKNQPRKEYDAEKLKEMSESFKKFGVIQPIEIDENNVIITGELRWRCAKLAGLKTIPCITKKTPTKDRLAKQLIENLNRQDMSIVNSLEAIKKYVQDNPEKSSMEISKTLGISDAWLRENLKIEKDAPSNLKKAIKNKKITRSQAVEIMKAPKEVREELTAGIIKEVKIPEYRIIRERVKKIKKIKEMKENYDNIEKNKSSKIRIEKSRELLLEYRSEMENLKKQIDNSVDFIDLWKEQDYSWWDNKSREQLIKILRLGINFLDDTKRKLENFEEIIR